MIFQKGAPIDRNIDGVWFSATVEEVGGRGGYLTIKYCDDQNVESEVSVDEVRARSPSTFSYGEDSKNAFEERLKPLAGLVEDDAEARRKHIPTTVIHDNVIHDVSEATDNAIVFNGAESKLAAGGGLRALRYLRH